MDKKMYLTPEMEEMDLKIETMLVDISMDTPDDIPVNTGEDEGWD